MSMKVTRCEFVHNLTCEQACDLITRLETENAKLREQLEYNRQTSRSRLERIDQLKDENAKLRELVARMAEALGIDCEWADPNWCKSPCVLEFECWPESDHTELRCPAWAIMHELGIEATA